MIGAFSNPANVANSKYKWDVNLFGINTGVGNNNASFKLSNLSESFSDIENSLFPSSGNKNLNALANVDILDPSVMLNIDPKNTFAITTRARVLSNVKDIDNNLVNSVRDNTDDITFPYTINSSVNQSIKVNGWSELGVTWGRVVINKENVFLKAGLSAKYLRGTGDTYVNMNSLKGTLSETSGGDILLSDATGRIATSTGVDFENAEISDILKQTGSGIGFDIGVVYELRPNKFNNAGEYKVRIAASIMDIGSIKYKNNPSYYGDYSMNIPSGQYFNVSDLEGKSFNEIKNVLDTSRFFTKNSTTANLTTSLPTTLQANIDVNLIKRFYLNIGGQFAINAKDQIQNPYYQNNITFTPRFESRSFGVFLPINYNSLTKLNAGLALRAGPFFIGSGSLLSLAISESKQMDFFMGLRFGGLRK
ncbi:MAG: DUF5723 family protein [Niabella sp.]